jgi:hypothetical protein
MLGLRRKAMHLKIDFPSSVSASRLLLLGALAFMFVFAFSGVASAQDNYRVTYFDNNGVTGAPDAYIHIVNPQAGALCADIYVWRADQELSECCSCPITTNGLLTLRVSQLTSNPGDHAGAPVSGSITIISDSSATCDPTAPAPAADLRAWATHVNVDTATSGYDVTETEALDTPLSTGEQTEASSRCGFIRVNGSGAGRCDAACGPTPI